MAKSLVIGAGGLLGRHVCSELARRNIEAVQARVPWSDQDESRAALADALHRALESGGDLTIWWCAGAGVTATPQTVLDAELNTLEGFVELVAVAGRESSRRITFFYASSAGGVLAGASTPPFTEETSPRPLAPYGWAKLKAESIVSTLVQSGVRVAIGRLANLYGEGQDLTKPQGLISQLCVAHHTARPTNIYVSLDTLRDYIYVADAARLCIDLTIRVAKLDTVQSVAKIVGSGQSVSIGSLLAEMRRLFKRRIPVVLAASPHAKQQARDLRLRSVVFPELDRRVSMPLVAGIERVNEDVGAQFRAGRLRQQ